MARRGLRRSGNRAAAAEKGAEKSPQIPLDKTGQGTAGPSQGDGFLNSLGSGPY